MMDKVIIPQLGEKARLNLQITARERLFNCQADERSKKGTPS